MTSRRWHDAHILRGDALMQDIERLIRAHTDAIPVADGQHVTLYALSRLMCAHTLAVMEGPGGKPATARELTYAITVAGRDSLHACAELEVHRRRRGT